MHKLTYFQAKQVEFTTALSGLLLGWDKVRPLVYQRPSLGRRKKVDKQILEVMTQFQPENLGQATPTLLVKNLLF